MLNGIILCVVFTFFKIYIYIYIYIMENNKKIIYYWNSNNLGDLLNIYIGLKYNYNNFKSIDYTKKNYKKKNNDNGIWLIGSVLKYIGKNNIILGVGFKNNIELKSFELNNNLCLYVRGNLSKKLLKNNNLKIFEPGLLINLLFNNDGDSKNEYLFIPHNKHTVLFNKLLNKDFLFNLKFDIEDLKIITEYNEKTKIFKLFDDKFKIISDSKLIISSSLHGIVLAIALKKPFIWFGNGYNDEPEFKFRDFFSYFDIICKKLDINNIDINNLDLKNLKPYINNINIDNYTKDIENFSIKLNNILTKYINL
jgi:pyruvyltransferase